MVRAAFVLAAFGWGCGFYGPPIFVHAVQARTGWSLALVSWAVTLHHLAAALLVLRMPLLHARWGLAAVASGGMVAGAIGILGWSCAGEPWQLMLAAMVSGCGSARASEARCSPSAGRR